MRIAFDATAIPPNRAGAGIYIYSLAKALAEIDENHYLVFAKAEHIQEFGITQPNFETISVDAGSPARRCFGNKRGCPVTCCIRRTTPCRWPRPAGRW